MIRVACIEPDKNLRDILSNYFIECKEIEFVGACSTVEEFITQSKYLAESDVILQSIGSENDFGLESIFKVKSNFPQVDIIFFTMTDYPELLFNAICAGASGYIIKSSPLYEIKAIIKMVFQGESEMTPSIARMVKAHFNDGVSWVWLKCKEITAFTLSN